MKIPNFQQAKQTGKNFEAFLEYSKDNYTSRVNANDLLGLERGLLENLRTVREVLEDGE